MKKITVKKLLLAPILLIVFLIPVYLLPQEASAAQRSDCNGQYISNRDKCKKEFDECNDAGKKAVCQDRIIRKYTIEGAGQQGEYQCGNLANEGNNVKTKFNFGCLGNRGPKGMGPIQDLVFALIRFASIGVGIAVTISLILAGLQYTAAEGNQERVQSAKQRAMYSVIALIIYIFAFSALQYLIPGGIFNPSFWIHYPTFINGLEGLL